MKKELIDLKKALIEAVWPYFQPLCDWILKRIEK